MKAFAGLLMFAGMLMATIVSYHVVAVAVPSWLTFWGIGVTLTYAGFLANILAVASE